MKILRASHMGMCFGVRDAITLARREAAAAPLTVLGDLVHNESVLQRLRKEGVQVELQPDALATHNVMITAHGASAKRMEEVHRRGHRVIEATCPLVRFAHDRVAELARAGFHPVIIGQRHHVEVRGLTEDLEAFDVVLEDTDVDALQPRERFGVAAQTTQPVARVQRLLARIRQRFPESEVRFADTVCLPTKRRQQAAEDIAARSDVVVVVGGAHSNNTRELVATCSRSCARVHHIQTVADLRAEWFRPADTVGITAGTSTPDDIINDVEAWLTRLSAEMEGAGEQDAAARTVACAAAE